MSNTKTTATSGGCGLWGIAFPVFIVFLILKLTGTIAWSWWWVTSPLWISLGVSLLFIFIVLVFLLIIGLFLLIAAFVDSK